MKPTPGTLRFVAGRVRREGWTAVARRIIEHGITEVVGKWHLFEPALPLREGDICSPGYLNDSPQPVQKTVPLSIGWVCTPPAPGSGGHTTFFRMVQGMEERGHHCTLFLYDTTDDPVDRHADTIRRHWPHLRASVRRATDGMKGMDALVASSWPTAHVVAARTPPGVHRFYFIQDYEPFFYPRGFLYSLAEDSYRLGLTTIALGGMIGEVMEAELGTPPACIVPFGCDTETYHLLKDTPPANRTGVVYYAKKNVDRRGYLLAKLALEQFHCLRPGQEIHVYGDTVTGWTIPVTNHGNLSPEELNSIYNRTIAGLAISFTNVSLVPGELLAAGNVPVLNGAGFAAGLLTDPDAVWAPGTPSGLARALAEVVDSQDIGSRALRIAGRDRPGWSVTQNNLAGFIESSCAGTREHARLSKAGETA